MSLKEKTEAYLREQELRKTSIGKNPNSYNPNTNIIKQAQPGA